MENKTSTFNAATAALLLAAATIGGCGKPAKPDLFGNGAAPAETILTPLRPGRWEMTGSDTELARPFGSTPLPQREPRPEETPRPRTFCLTPQQAAAPGPEVFGLFDKSDCERRYWKVAGGQVDGDLICKGHAEDIPEYPARLNGTYARDSFEVEVEYHALGMDFRQRLTAKRTGDCPYVVAGAG